MSVVGTESGIPGIIISIARLLQPDCADSAVSISISATACNLIEVLTKTVLTSSYCVVVGDIIFLPEKMENLT